MPEYSLQTATSMLRAKYERVAAWNEERLVDRAAAAREADQAAELAQLRSKSGLQPQADRRDDQANQTQLRASHREKDEPLLTLSTIMAKRLDKLPDYCHPNVPDHLFHSSYEHVPSAFGCDKCDKKELIAREERYSRDPVIHYGGIASGNQVMRDGTARDAVAKELSIICFEMEAAGLMDVLPCLPIRGICDYSDSHKSKAWQRYAAFAAAALARDLLGVLPLTVEEARAAFSIDSERRTRIERRESLLQSLKFEQITSREASITDAHAKTCQWLLDHSAYEAWLDPSQTTRHHGLLWISGKPGAGKSTIMKYIYLKTKHQTRKKITLNSSFFFHSRGEYLERSISGMYRSILAQLLEGFPALQVVLDNPKLDMASRDDWPLSILKELLQKAVFSLGSRALNCFIDALDECDEQQIVDMVQFFEDLLETAMEKKVEVRICFSSRHYPYIDVRRGIRMTLDDQLGHDQDLAAYVQDRLRVKGRMVKELHSQILEKAAGVFLWVVLVVEILNKEDRRGGLALKKRLHELPNGLSELFKNILTRDDDNMEELLLCIMLILYAKRPLGPEEYYHALWCGLSIRGLVDPDIPDASNKGSVERSVISSSKGLAEITSSKSYQRSLRVGKLERPVVQFIHESVRDFLLKEKGIFDLWPDIGPNPTAASHESIKQCCIKYMQYCTEINLTNDSLLDGEVRTQFDLADEYGFSSVFDARKVREARQVDSFKFEMEDDIEHDYVFLGYASENVLYHANAAAATLPQDKFLVEFPVTKWIGILNNCPGAGSRARYQLGTDILYVLADQGLSRLIRTRLCAYPRINLRGDKYQYPLFAALAGGHRNSVAALLRLPANTKTGIDIVDSLTYGYDFQNYLNRTMLSWASQEHHTAMLGLLLEQGCAQVDEIDPGGQTALLRAIQGNDQEIVNMLLDYGADPDTAGREGTRPLYQALRDNCIAIMKTLLTKGADPNLWCHDSEPPLYWCYLRNSLPMARLLLEHGADPNPRCRSGTSLLCTAVSSHSTTFSRLILEHGVNVNETTDRGQSILVNAVEDGYYSMVALLLEMGADTNACDTSGIPVLKCAVSNGHESIARLLMRKGALARN
ncbi:unnamed protein product [Clonostachys byssicola]|uniref:Nephrocystin 3-like N-terminal domain-containing protein n=1 Tax=Clonostachys byssicola TaxID=160290 RepID=A0A9N9UNX2_9HYPO|nr:unnamed protein product [Clonostachys byssicola]